jgi:ribonuclease P protein component
MSREEIADVMKRGTRVHGLLCTYVWRPRNEGGVSVVVSKKIAKTAVARNRIKRRMRAAARGVPELCRAIVMIAKPGASNATVSGLTDEFKKHMTRGV